MKAIFHHSQPEAENIRTFWFKPERPLRFVAGQYTELTLKHDNPDNRGIKRWLTISSSPTDELISITTKFAEDKASTFKKTLFSLPEGAEVQLADAMGDFVLPKQKDRPLVFIAGGIGVTPMHSMIKWLVNTDEKRNIYLLYGSRSNAEVAFRDLFEAAHVTFEVLLERLTADKILALPGVKDGALVYISGPEPMVQALNTELKEKGVDDHRIVVDEFPGYPGI